MEYLSSLKNEIKHILPNVVFTFLLYQLFIGKLSRVTNARYSNFVTIVQLKCNLCKTDIIFKWGIC